jgi:CheY-like chemotaxis protein
METILVLDDNRQISDFLVGEVLPNLGYQTMAAYGKSGLELIRQNHKSIDQHLGSATAGYRIRYPASAFPRNSTYQFPLVMVG